MIYYVNAKAGRDGNGSKQMPFKRINDAAKVAVAGDEIVVAPGIYRESVHPVNPGREDARIVYRSEEPLGAVITGAEELTGWTRHEGSVWVNRVNNGLFGSYNPYTTQVRGDWYFAPEIRHTGAVFLNDQMMYETTSLEECAAAQPDPCAFDKELSTWKWYTEQDGDETVLYANFKDLDPNEQKVEILARRNCFMPEENGIDYITVSGFDINKAATTWAPPAAYQDGMIGPHWSKGWIIEDCHIHHVCNSQQLGGAETAGIKLHAAIDVTIRRNHIHNCIMGVWLDWEAQGARVSQNLFHDNQRPDGTPQAKGAMFNCDVFIEVGHGPTLIDNNVMLSKESAVLPSEGVACVHNLMCGGFGLINSGVDSVVNGQREPRYTPYHIRHRTEVAGFMTILHGDDRIYNNLFVQKWPVTDATIPPQAPDNQIVGTAPFDIFPSYEEWISHFDFTREPDMGALGTYHFGHLPVWVKGNAYFNGASVSKHEQHGASPEGEAKVELAEKDGKVVLETNLYDLLGDFADGIITSDILGCAFEPEQRFENPDGTEIIFNRDYLGEHRGARAIPGPFAAGKREIVVY